MQLRLVGSIQATHERCAKLCEPRPAPTVDSGLPRGERLRGARWGPGVAGALLAVRRQHLRSGRSARSQAVEADPLCWLEELETPAVRSWVEAQNARSLSQLGDPRHSPLWPRLCETETTDTEADPLRKLPQATEIGGYFYDFWSDASHVRGVWRRTSLESFLTASPVWEVVLDLDELCRAEGESYVWRGFDVEAVQEPPERAMLLLSRGGQDAFVAREFDLTRRAFVEEAEGGFVVPEGKSVVSFCSRDVLLVSGDFGPGTLTNAGYPRCVRVWRRGTRLTSSPLLFEGDAHDHVVFGYVPSKALQVVQRSLNFHAAEWYLREGDGLERPLQKLLVPQDAELSIFKDLLVLHLRSDFQHFPQGAVLVQGAAKALAGGEWQLLWAPERDQHQRSSTLRKLVATRSFLVLQILDLTLQGQLLVFQHDEATQQWRQHWSSSGDDSLVSLSVRAVSCRSDGLWLGRAGFRQPPALFYAEDIAQWKDGNWHWLFEGGGARLVRRLPQLYEAAPVEEMRLEARSADGTLVPFTCLRPRNCGEAPPTLVYAYGGFGIPLLPNYNASIGAAWLERGGQYIEANLRGGGEFGPAWERAGRGALGRLKVYEDLEAVADELVARGLAAPGDLALMGRSNGGLLVANALVREVRGARGARRFRAFVAEVPLTDMRHYHTWLAGHSWLEEYGDPEQKWEELRQISAYHLAQELQARESEDPRALRVLFTTSTRDDRVHPCHARKMVKLLQSLQLPNLQTFLYESQEGGHGGAASIGERALLRTLEYEFLWQSLTS